MSKIGIKETLEVIDCADSIVSDLLKHKSDDGKISVMEIGQTAVANIPETLTAIIGSNQIPSELMDIDKDEAILISKKAVNVFNKLIKIFKI